MRIYSTSDAGSQFTNILLYGLAGAGKTPLAATAPNPIIVSTEPGLKSLQRYKLPYVVAMTGKEALDVLDWLLKSNECRQFQSVFFDSISALSEVILAEEKTKSNDPRKFSPQTTARTMEIVKKYLNGFRGNKHIIMTCKAVELTDQITSVKTIELLTVVPKLSVALPYDFDQVMYLSRHKKDDGGEIAAFRCRINDYAPARDRSGNLDLWEPADLTHVINKVNGVK